MDPLNFLTNRFKLGVSALEERMVLRVKESAGFAHFEFCFVKFDFGKFGEVTTIGCFVVYELRKAGGMEVSSRLYGSESCGKTEGA